MLLHHSGSLLLLIADCCCSNEAISDMAYQSQAECMLLSKLNLKFCDSIRSQIIATINVIYSNVSMVISTGKCIEGQWFPWDGDEWIIIHIIYIYISYVLSRPTLFRPPAHKRHVIVCLTIPLLLALSTRIGCICTGNGICVRGWMAMLRAYLFSVLH